jgi:hypothetical protein
LLERNDDFCKEIIDSKIYYVAYFKLYNQLYCSTAPEILKGSLFDLPVSETGGWLKGDLWIDREIFFQHFSAPDKIFTKRIKGKQILHLDGSAKHCAHSGSSSPDSRKNV